MKSSSNVTVVAMERRDMPFLISLWHNHAVMHFTDEFPRFRGWSRLDEIKHAWEIYDAKRKELGNKYTQLIIKMQDGTRIGESFFVSLPEEYKLGEWQKPKGIVTFTGDIKLAPEYWEKGFATKAMRRVVYFAFERGGCGIFLVLPHKNNLAAIRVYEKAGFEPIREKPPWVNRIIMTLSRQQYIQIYPKKKK
jgi:RimJ/RimL family protein N-acetyltransferase